tara:strand:+ start:467 stop:622 length:156 start_codon:yes stop_codon:yes gene_type:complete
MREVLPLIAALLVFIGWISSIGNPHVVETVIGLMIASGTYFFVWIKTKKRG